MPRSDVEWAVEDVKARAPQLATYVDYDEGRHRLLFATEKYRNTFGDLFREFADNMCDDVLDAISDRLQIDAWTSDDKTLAQVASDLWVATKGEARTGAVHRSSYREGDGWLAVQENEKGQARVFKQDPRQMVIRYSTDDPDEPEVVAKVWKDVRHRRWRVNLWYAEGLVEKWGSKGLGANGGIPKAQAFHLLPPGDPGLREDEQAQDDLDRIPVYHFPNGEPGRYGRSLLAGVIPLQDALNKAICDMLVAMEYHAYPQRWATGVQVERDEHGRERSPFQAGEGRVWRSGNKDARLGQFDPAEMTGFLDVQDALKISVARKGLLPPHQVTLRSQSSTPPTGIALLVAEGRTIKFTLDRQRDYGDQHRRWMAHALSIQLGTEVDPQDLNLSWAPPETRDEKALLEMLTMKRDLGVPDRQIMLEMGYTPDEVTEFLDDLAERNEADAAVLSVLQGGRGGVAPSQAQTLNGALGLPGGPGAPEGSATALGSA